MRVWLIAGEFDFAPGIATINYPALVKNAKKDNIRYSYIPMLIELVELVFL